MPIPAPFFSALEARATQARIWLFDHALPLWWERGYDAVARCFHERLALDCAPVTNLPRRVRVQARQTAVFARAGQLGWPGPWREAVEAGVRVLRERCLRPDGGARHLLSPTGEQLDERRDFYDLAFVAFAFAEATSALGDRSDLIADAEALVAWAEQNWADPDGGFAEGEVTPTPPRRQNPHMHLFEALLALHEATGDERYLLRADRIADLFETRLYDAKHGALPEYYESDWRPRSGDEGRIVEPGHHFEWSWLLHRWGEHRGDRLANPAERLRVHAEVYGVDLASGAVFDELYIDGRARTRTSRFWPHTERIKANIVRFERTRDFAAGEAAIQAFDMLMRYCDTPTKGLWRDRLNPDGAFVEEAAPASSFYHIMLALSELIRVAEGLEAPRKIGG
jgi:mannose-6-phosphate isomerase